MIQKLERSAACLFPLRYAVQMKLTVWSVRQTGSRRAECGKVENDLVGDCRVGLNWFGNERSRATSTGNDKVGNDRFEKDVTRSSVDVVSSVQYVFARFTVLQSVI